MSVMPSRQPSGPGQPRFEPHDQPSVQTDLAQRNRWTRRILYASLLYLPALLALLAFDKI